MQELAGVRCLHLETRTTSAQLSAESLLRFLRRHCATSAFSNRKQPFRGRFQTVHDGIRNPSASRASVKRRSGRPPKTSVAAGRESAVDPGRELSLSFEQEVNADADAQEDYRTLRAREAENIHSVKIFVHRGGSAQQSSAAEVANPLHPLPSPHWSRRVCINDKR